MIAMIKIIIFFIVMCPLTTFADKWTNSDTFIETLYASLHVADWNQTLQIVKDDRRGEKNKILGSFPSKDQVDLYFTTTLIGHYYIAKNINQPYRALWQILWIGRQLKAINHNRKAGLQIDFKF